MPLVIKGISDQERSKLTNVPPVLEHEATFAKRAGGSVAEANKAFKDWQKNQPVPAQAKNPNVTIKAAPLSTASIETLVTIATSDQAPQELINQKLDEQQFFGMVFSALTLYEYVRMQGELQKRRAAKGTALTADRDWAQVVKGFQSAFTAAGLNVTEAQLTASAKDLAGNKRQLETVARIAHTRVVRDDKTPSPAGVRATALDGGALIGSFTTATARIIDPNIFTVVIPNLCSQPFAQGSFTKHWSDSWSFSVSFPYPCPTWTNPFRICWSTLSVATVSVNIGLDVGYKVSCCGATAWGQAYAQACGSIAGITKCVGCTATVVGVAGFSRTPAGSQCTYGLGINASIVCQVFGATVFSASWPFGYTITGPCPPPGLC